MNYTPGPWIVSESDDGFTYWIEANVGPVASNVEKEDALLIATAPELLETLEGLLAFYGEDDNEWIDQARTVLAKATGEK